jgi:hypothetical protein
MEKVLISPKWSNENCWLWLGALHPQNNTPIYSDHKLLLSPRRIIWQAYNLDERLERRLSVVVPICGVVECVNPYHLVKMSQREFINYDARCLESHALTSEATKERFALITHCPKGHEYSAANTGIEIKKTVWNRKAKGDGYKCRYCKTCKAERNAEYRKRKGQGATRLATDYDKGGLLSLEVMDMEFKRPPRGF